MKLKVFKDLMIKKEKSLSKLDNLEYEGFTMQDYLKSRELDINQIRSLFKYRPRMAKVATNFSHSYVDLSCPLCKSSSDTQEHLLSCSTLKNEVPELKLNLENSYKHIFDNNIKKDEENNNFAWSCHEKTQRTNWKQRKTSSSWKVNYSEKIRKQFLFQWNPKHVSLSVIVIAGTVLQRNVSLHFFEWILK